MDTEPQLKQKVMSGVVWRFGEKFLAQGIAFIVSLVLARLLSPEDYGAVAIVLIFVTIADVVLSSGFNMALIQKVNATEEDYSTVFYVNLSLALILYIIVFFLAPFLSELYNLPELTNLIRIIALKLPISSYNTIQIAYISRNMQFKLFFFSTLVGTIISAVVGIVMAYKGCGAYSLAGQQLTNLIIDTSVLFVTVKWKPKFIFSKRSFLSMLPFSIKNMATDMTGTIFNQLNPFIIGIKYSTTDLAYYTKGQQLPSVLNTVISSSLTSVLFPAIAKVSNENEKTKEALRRSIRMTSFILFPIMTGLIVLASSIVTILYTDKWIAIVPYMQLMCVDIIISTIGSLDVITLRAIGKSGVALVLEFIKKPVYLILILVAMNYGVFMLAVAAVCISFIGLSINSVALKKYIKYSFFEKLLDCLYPFIACVLMALVVYSFYLLPVTNLYLKTTICVIVGGMIYVLFALITKNKEFNEIYQYIKVLSKKIIKRDTNK